MSHIFLVYGSTKPLVEDKVNKIISHYIDEIDDFNFSRYDLTETPFEVIEEDAMTLPFLSEQKVIVVNNSYIFTGEKLKVVHEINLDHVVTFLEKFEGPNIVIFKVMQDKLDERKKIVKRIKKDHTVEKIEPLDEDGMKKLIQQNFNQQFKDIKADALEEMIHLTGLNYSNVVKEIDKLMLFVGDQPVITKQNVTEVVSRSLEQNVFLLTDYIAQGQKKAALYLLKDLINMKEEPIKLLALICSQYRLFYQVKILSQKGFSEAQIAKQVKVHPYRVKLAMRKVRTMELKQLLSIMSNCAKTDYELKSSYIDKALILELLILKI
ncbi:DNA polymerase III subunit delta [Macrococcoides caseolyticum]|uniref:DNA polymerase III subunit delta n=1 Tax=Macrococcoides caseolyticum TaxID=69966 RepID=UPI001F4614B3|nr:DNA polymerase III subunit delta [Macrococcus caseolyticus]MCE4956165.1 DNA polymerase III subunit delta [Macrococcus caseolyticus]